MTGEVDTLPSALRSLRLLLVFFLVVGFVVVIIVVVIVIFFGDVVLAVFVFFHFIVVRDDVHVHRVNLRHFHLRFTLGAAQDLSLFHFVFIHIEFCSTIRAADHGHFLRSEIPRLGVTLGAALTIQRIIYRAGPSRIQHPFWLCCV